MASRSSDRKRASTEYLPHIQLKLVQKIYEKTSGRSEVSLHELQGLSFIEDLTITSRLLKLKWGGGNCLVMKDHTTADFYQTKL